MNRTAQKIKNENLAKRIFRITAVMLILSLISQVYVSNTSAIKSTELAELQQKEELLEKEITNLRYEIAIASRLSYVEEQALQRGFVKMNEDFLSVKPVTVAVAANR